MEKITLDTKGGKYSSLFQKGTKYNNVALVYYHGLGGKAKVVKPLTKYFSEFDFFSVDERGHNDSFQQPSTSVKKHDNDVLNVTDFLKTKYEHIYLCGESMGALFAARQGYKNKNVKGIFVWSIPFAPKDIMKNKKGEKIKIITKVILTFLTCKNFKYESVIDYDKLTNSRFLQKLNEMEVKTPNNTAEEVVIWKASLSFKRKFIYKKPLVPIFYWQGENDIMSNQKIINLINKKGYVKTKIIDGAKHILMFENGSEIIWQEMINFMKSNL